MRRKIISFCKWLILFIIFIIVLAFIWAKIENKGSIYGFILFLLGSGEIQGYNVLAQIVFSIFSILSIAFLSSALTVSWLEYIKRLKISPNMIIGTIAGKQNGTFFIENTYNDIYKVSATLCLNTQRGDYSEEKQFFFIPKGESRLIDFQIEPGSLLYKYFVSSIKQGLNSVLALVISYTNSTDGQEYIFYNKYNYGSGKSNISVNNGLVKINKNNEVKMNMNKFLSLAKTINNEYEEYFQETIDNKNFVIDINQVKPIQKENITIKHGVAPATKREILDVSIKDNDANKENLITSVINFAGKSLGDCIMGMALISNPLGGNWQKYYDMDCYLSFYYYTSPGIVLAFELKDKSLNNIVQPRLISTDGYTEYTLKLADLNREQWECIAEMCFSVLKNEVKVTEGEFSIVGCELIRPDII